MNQEHSSEASPVAAEGGSPAGSETLGAAKGAAETAAVISTEKGGVACTRKVFWLTAAGLSALCLVVRVIHLMALPIFGDEAIYLRWTQVIRGEGISWGSNSFHLWVSLCDPKPPLHFWLLAVVYHWTADPLLAARLLSVAAGVVCVPVLMAVGNELGRVMVRRENQVSGFGLGILAAVLAIFCPFLAFYQRLATADSLFVAESLVIVWLSLRWGRMAFAAGATKKSRWLTAAGLGVAIGAGLMTRQGVSYTMCAMPVVAWLMHASRFLDARAKMPKGAEGGRPKFLPLLGRGVLQLSVAAVIAGAIWTPFLTAELKMQARAKFHQVTDDPDAPVTWGQMKDEVKRRIFYQSSFTETSDHVGLAERNAYVAFVPGWNIDGNPTSGWMPIYLTYLVFGLSLAGVVYTAIRQPAVAVLLGVWFLLLVAPIVLMVENIYSRYVLAGVPPLLMAGAFLLGDTVVLVWKAKLPEMPRWGLGVVAGVLVAVLGWRLMPGEGGMGKWSYVVLAGAGLAGLGAAWWLVRKMEPKAGRANVGGVIILVLAGVLLWLPAEEMGRQMFDWRHQNLTFRFDDPHGNVRGDNYQYLTGWTAGQGTQGAIAYLRDMVEKNPDKQYVIITGNEWGTPADAMWVYLSGEKNVQMFLTDYPGGGGKRVLVPAAEKGTFRLKDDKYLFPPERAVHFAADATVFFVTNDPHHDDVTDPPAARYFGGNGGGANPNFGSPKTFYGIEGGERVAVFPINRQ